MLKKAAQLIQDRCDGAREQDGAGYNKFDKDFGYWLASTDETYWTPETKRKAWEMLRKYKRQLTDSGLNFDEIPEPEKIDDDLGVKTVALNRAAATAAATATARPKQPSVITMTGSMLYFSFEYNKSVVSEVQKFPRRKFDDSCNPKRWIVNVVSDNVDPVLKFIENHPEFTVADGIVEKMKSIKQVADAKLAASKAATSDFEVEGLGGTLRPFQRAGVKYAVEAERVLIGDDMGLGKTVEGLATVHALKAYPAIVVCPASLKLNWQKEIHQWLPSKTVSVWDGKLGDTADLVVINYDNLQKRLPDLLGIGAKSVVLDEMHYCKNGKAQRTKAVKELAATIKYRIGLTGTPVMNRPNELISLLTILDRLKDVGGYKHYIYRYCNAYQDRFGMNTSGGTNLQELNTKLRQTCYIRREKSEVLKELPPKQRNVITVGLSNRREYDRAESDLIAFLKENAVDDEFLESIAHLSEQEQQDAIQYKEDSAAQAAHRAEHLVRIEKLKQLSAAGKMDAAIEWIENFLESGKKLLVFAHHQSVINALCEKLSAPSITGSTKIEERQRLKERFQSDPSMNLLVLNIRAGGVGLTLTKASDTLFIEQDWTPAAQDQAEDRVNRIGQEASSITAWYMLAERSIDEDIYSLIDEKRIVTQAVIEGKAVAKKQKSVLGGLIDALTQKGKK